MLIGALLASGCAGSGQKVICKPVPSFASPAVSCVAEAPPPPPKPEPKPEPEPEPEPVAKPEPEPEPPPVVVKKEEIQLDRTVQFEPDSAKLIDDSKELLDDVAKALEEHPEVKQVQIGGHTDARMSKRHNKKLSQARAKAVRAYLIDKGIAKDRLVAMGFGETKPVADNSTWKGRFQNRRVELKITKRDENGDGDTAEKPEKAEKAEKMEKGEKAEETTDSEEAAEPEQKAEKPAKKDKKKKKAKAEDDGE